ncbi:MAG: peptidoglycan DD-metalloendopeptidase family protein [Alphaproteobacteria bacterium]|nr:peptidoglycan DD-metalloendopeptidase family protein [Alphaproteobacteria bacterium]
MSRLYNPLMRTYPLVVCFFALVSASLPAPTYAQTKDDLRKIESQIGKQQQKVEALDKKAQETSEGLKDLRGKLVVATENLQVKETEKSKLEDKLEELTRDIAAKSLQLESEREKLNALLSAFIELSRQPPESFFLRSGPTTDHIHRGILLRSALPRLQQQADAIARDLAGLSEAQEKMIAQKRLVTTAQRNLDEQRRSLDQLVKTRQGMLTRTEAQKETINRQLAALANQAQDLRQLLDKVAPRGSKPSVPRALRGFLRWPVAGTVVRPFGGRDADGVVNQGLTLSASSGSPIVAPQEGRVMFAGPFKGYGQIMILQHDGGYHSFLAGFGRIDAEVGQDVNTGEPLGVMPVKSAGKPELYFEWRHNSEPVDPTERIKR